jgi:solute carrier family 24 (sodium/potassium/calcium exchanger), member 6
MLSACSWYIMSDCSKGITILAFGNGAPDVFSTFAAVTDNNFDIAVGELTGMHRA